VNYDEPWTIDPPNLESGGLEWERFDIVSVTDHQIATVEGFRDEPHTPEQALQVAQRIAACVNALASVADPGAVLELVEAAREALYKLEIIHEFRDQEGCETCYVEKNLRKALAPFAGVGKAES